jgi:glycosyltransferase involved in cell wall biosynthesis
LKKILAKAKFVVVPSVWYENFPYVILQAFASAKPVIASNRGGIPELVDEDKGVLVDPDRVDSLVRVIADLWNDDNKCIHMGNVARKYVEDQFTDECFYKDIIDHYRSVMA